MKKHLLLPLLVICTLVSFSQITPWRPGEMEVKVRFLKEGDAGRFAALSLNSDINSSFAYAYLVPAELERIKEAGLSYEVLKPNLNDWSASFGAALVPPGYYTFSQIKNIADSLATHFPSICKKVVFGFNQQMQELAALKISDNAMTDEAEPEIMLDGGIHGDEVGGSQNMIQLARDLCLGYGTDVQITNLVNTREIWLFYCVNPYGRDNMTRYNSAGVDVNRDYCYMWGGEGNSTGPCSQPESKALRKCQYENQFVSYTNYHSGTEIISYPWSYRYSPPPDVASIAALADVYASASGYSSLPYGQGSVVMYLIQGSTKDFNYGALGSVAWSIEISLDKQPSNPQYYYNINKPAMLALIEHAGYGIQGTVTDAVSGKPVAASVFVGNNYPVYSDPEVGDYHKYLIAGTYTLRFVANGYQTKTISNVNVANLQCTTLDVQLTPEAGQYAYRVISTRIPAFNAQNPGDECYTAACLGKPDQVNYSLGKGGYVVIDMQDTIVDGDSASFDIMVYEGDATPEGYTLYAGNTMDGPWTSLGLAMGSASFDLGASGVQAARYFKLLDDNNGTANVNDAGFDLDAIRNLHPAIPDTVGHLSGYVYDALTHLPLPGVSVASGDSLVLSDSTGHYSLELIRGTREICASGEGFRQECDTLLMLPAGTCQHDFYLFSTVGEAEFNSPEPRLNVYPNPFTDGFKIQLPSPVVGLCRVELTDLSGRKLFTAKRWITPGTIEIDLLNFSGEGLNLCPGSYILTLFTPESSYNQKVVKSY